ncbi:MAG: hypothetical protein M0Z76_04435 [Gammaproteobacteria bacterium]|nr:hypothetical protein [Gammaproteobacteria bacterium]
MTDLIHAGQPDEAGNVAHRLPDGYQEVIDGHERLAMVYEARTDQRQAAKPDRLTLGIIDGHPGDYDPEIRAHVVNRRNGLDPANTPPAPLARVPR